MGEILEFKPPQEIKQPPLIVKALRRLGLVRESVPTNIISIEEIRRRHESRNV